MSQFFLLTFQKIFFLTWYNFPKHNFWANLLKQSSWKITCLFIKSNSNSIPQTLRLKFKYLFISSNYCIPFPIPPINKIITLFDSLYLICITQLNFILSIHTLKLLINYTHYTSIGQTFSYTHHFIIYLLSRLHSIIFLKTDYHLLLFRCSGPTSTWPF